MEIVLEKVSKSFDGKQKLAETSLSFAEGSVTCLTGPSGCGKTTLLNIIAGILTPDCGTVSGIGGRTMAYAFQEPRLLPWKSVSDNIDFVLKEKFSPEERKRRISEWLSAVHLENDAEMLPAQLSGGMAQRASLARALALEADILLLDEPFTGIDEAVKSDIVTILKEFWKTAGTTVILVSHDLSEASALGANIVRLG